MLKSFNGTRQSRWGKQICYLAFHSFDSFIHRDFPPPVPPAGSAPSHPRVTRHFCTFLHCRQAEEQPDARARREKIQLQTTGRPKPQENRSHQAWGSRSARGNARCRLFCCQTGSCWNIFISSAPESQRSAVLVSQTPNYTQHHSQLKCFSADKSLPWLRG